LFEIAVSECNRVGDDDTVGGGVNNLEALVVL
jgi:hypothetical protein